MKGKLAFVLGAAVGYVLGARAGRERYEQIKRGAQKVWNTGPVQSGVGVVKRSAEDRIEEVKAFAIRFGTDALSNLTKPKPVVAADTGTDAEESVAAGGAGAAEPEPAEEGAEAARPAAGRARAKPATARRGTQTAAAKPATKSAAKRSPKAGS